MKHLCTAVLVVSLATSASATMHERPSVPPRGTEGPDTRSRIEPKGGEGPDVRLVPPKRIGAPDVRVSGAAR
jgi:hypothetical protein